MYPEDGLTHSPDWTHPVKAGIAVAKALEAKNKGAIDNGPTLPYPQTKKKGSRTMATPVQVKRAPVEHWTCDSCGTTDFGPAAMYKHTEDTDHKVYTKTEIS